MVDFFLGQRKTIPIVFNRKKSSIGRRRGRRGEMPELEGGEKGNGND